MFGPWGWRGMMGGPGLIGSFFGLLSCLVFLAVVALVIWLIVRLVRSPGTGAAGSASYAAPPPSSASAADPVLETLRRRLAEGAITQEEFDQLREKLGV